MNKKLNKILIDLEKELNSAKEMEEICIGKGYWDGIISNQATIRGFEKSIEIVKKYKL